MPSLRLLDPAKDAPALHDIFGDDDACTYLLEGATTSVAETQALLERYQESSSPTTWAILDDDGTVAGRVTLFSKDGGWSEETGYVPGKVWELGIMMCPGFQGRGLAFAGCCEAIDIVDDVAKPRRITSDIDPDNTASIRLCERLGFCYEGTLRNLWHTHIGVRDTYMMSLTSGDKRPWRSTISP
ncbi:MAG: GNAT family N-acetyltransferase [Pseudomonadota bacterium]